MTVKGPTPNVAHDSTEGSSGPPAVHAYLFGAFRIDVPLHSLSRDGEVVPLTAKAFDTLLALVRHRDRVLGKDELMGLVWPKSFVSEDSLAQSISVLRRALDDDSNQPEFIATIPRRGYRFVATVTEIVDHEGAVLPAAPPATPIVELHPQPATASLPPMSMPVPMPQPPRALAPARRRSLVILTLLLAGAAAAVLVWRTVVARREPAADPIRFTLSAPNASRFIPSVALSPDGRRLAFVAQDDRSGKTRIWIRDLDSTEPRVVDGTEGGFRPFWSPDGRSLGFFANYTLKRVDLDGNSPRTLASIGALITGASWSSNGVILFSVWRSGLYSVAASGGTHKSVTTLDSSAKESAHRSPQFLPDGRHFLYSIISPEPERTGTFVGSLDSSERVRLIDTDAVYAPPGYLLYVREGALTAQGFDASRRQLTGSPIVIAGNVSPSAIISASEGGRLAFGGSPARWHLQWSDRSGEKLGTIEAPVILHNPMISPDHKQVLADANDAGHSGFWLIELERGAATRIQQYGGSAVWSPDGARIVFGSDQVTGISDLYIRSMAGANETALLVKSSESKTTTDWSADGRYVVYISTSPKTKTDIWLVPMSGDRKPIPYLQTPFNEIQARVSPDGHWLAYASDESGTWEVYVQSFPIPGGKRAISIGGGAQPQWRGDGKELFYLATDHRMMAVDVTSGDTWAAGRPRPLFRTFVTGTLGDIRTQYAVTADGQRFLVDSADEDPERDPITFLVNWTAAAKR